MTHDSLIQQAMQHLQSQIPIPEKLAQETVVLQEQAESADTVDLDYTEEDIPVLARHIYQYILESDDAQQHVQARITAVNATYAHASQLLREKVAAKIKCGRRMKINEAGDVKRENITLPEQLQYNALLIESMQLSEAISNLRLQLAAADEEAALLEGLLAETGEVKRRNRLAKKGWELSQAAKDRDKYGGAKYGAGKKLDSIMKRAVKRYPHVWRTKTGQRYTPTQLSVAQMRIDNQPFVGLNGRTSLASPNISHNKLIPKARRREMLELTRKVRQDKAPRKSKNP